MLIRQPEPATQLPRPPNWPTSKLHPATPPRTSRARDYSLKPCPEAILAARGGCSRRRLRQSGRRRAGVNPPLATRGFPAPHTHLLPPPVATSLPPWCRIRPNPSAAWPTGNTENAGSPPRATDSDRCLMVSVSVCHRGRGFVSSQSPPRRSQVSSALAITGFGSATALSRPSLLCWRWSTPSTMYQFSGSATIL
jgi:hypothetical protein